MDEYPPYSDSPDSDFGAPPDAPPQPAAPTSETLHAVDAERGILGALIENNNVLDDLEDNSLSVLLTPEMFYDKRHIVLMETMNALRQVGSYDARVLAKHLVMTDKISDAGGKEYIADLAMTGAHRANLPAYVQFVYDTALKRDMIAALNENLRIAHAPTAEPPQAILDKAEANLMSVGDRFLAYKEKTQQIGKIAQDYFNRIAEMVKKQDFKELMGLPTGYASLDKLTTGLHGGDLLILAGRPGTGKTAFSLNILRHVTAEANMGAVFFSLEMRAEQLVERMLSYQGVNLRKLALTQKDASGKRMDGRELANFAEAVSVLNERKIYIDDNSLISVLSARAQARRIKRRMDRQGIKLGLVVIDYLQLMEPEVKSDSRAIDVSTISRGLKALAKELNVPVLALSQLNRSVDSRPAGTPQLSDLRESGAIEQDADLVMFLYEKKKSSDGGAASTPAAPTTAEQPIADIVLEIGKQRNGPTGIVHLKFNKPFSKYTEAAPHEIPHSPPQEVRNIAPNESF